MAIEYTLYLDTNDSTLHIYGIVCTYIGIESNAVPTSPLVFSGEALQGVVLVPDDMTRRFVGEDFALDAKVRVVFRLDKFDMARAQESLIRCISELACGSDGDMVLLFNGELVVLRRKAGDLVLREGFGVWTAERLTLLGIPYRIGPM